MKRLIPAIMIVLFSLILSHGSLSGKDDGLKKVQTWLKGLGQTYTLKDLKTLTELDLRYNQLKTLPKELGNLKALENLDLKGNPLRDKEKAKIKKLLPKCDISF